jgi:hypothetical protein
MSWSDAWQNSWLNSVSESNECPCYDELVVRPDDDSWCFVSTAASLPPRQISSLVSLFLSLCSCFADVLNFFMLCEADLLTIDDCLHHKMGERLTMRHDAH